MKKLLRICGAVLALALLLGVTALAAAPPEGPGIYGITLEPDYAGIPYKVLRATESGEYDPGIAKVEAEIDGGVVDFYPDGVKLWFELDVPEGFNLVLGLNEDDVPTEENIEYIDQQSTEGGKVRFTVYPKSQSGTVIVKLANAEGVKKVLSFKLYQAYMPGDVDEDGFITATDALWILQNAAMSRDFSAKQLLAGDVDKDSYITATDALWVLQFAAGVRTEF
ncbi:MAG: hypothetical protein IKS66_06590 [Oscillospiraceae bacterium]|nr:hypothetical protein [Oscillospiraceae bacterium]